MKRAVLAFALCAGSVACDLDAVNEAVEAARREGVSITPINPPRSDQSGAERRSRRRRRPSASPVEAPVLPPPMPALATGEALQQMPFGPAVDASPQDEMRLDRAQFVVSYNRFRNAPNWVAWRLSASDLGSTGRTRDGFAPDPQLPDGVYRPLQGDYRGSGFDRGHLCPSAHRTRAPADNAATFSMSNILPQRHDMNAGPWEALEAWAVDRARQGWDVYHYAGGLWPAVCATDRSPGGNFVDASCPSIGRSEDPARRIAVPASTWKVIVLTPAGSGAAGLSHDAHVIAVDMPNDGSATPDWRRYQVTVDALEQRTGYNFLAGVDEALQRTLESRLERLP